ncbi:MAG: hypothetical protein KGZ69_09905 [Methylomonas sp.]|nr:hypothetical protein [Methylomonas sp.]
MIKRYMWLVHNRMAHDAEISEANIMQNNLPVQTVELNKRYGSFVIFKKDTDDFLDKIKTLFTCACKIYEFSEEGMLLGEHYLEPSSGLNVFMPWIAEQSQVPPRRNEYDYFFFVDFNATFKVTDKITHAYLHASDCRYDVLECAKTEPAFYTRDNYFTSKLKVQMHYADVLLVMGLLFKMLVENHSPEDEGSMTVLYGQFGQGRLRVFDRWCIPNIWTLSHDASFGHEMPLFCQWEFEQIMRKSTAT